MKRVLTELDATVYLRLPRPLMERVREKAAELGVRNQDVMRVALAEGMAKVEAVKSKTH